jgi:hypothetical protein
MNAVQWWRRQYRLAKDLTKRRTGVYGGPASDRIGDAMVRHIRAVVPVLRAFPTRTVRFRELSVIGSGSSWPATTATVTLTDAAGRTASFATLAAEIRDIVPNTVPRTNPLFAPETHEFKVDPLDYSIPLRWEFTAVMIDPIINMRGEVAE